MKNRNLPTKLDRPRVVSHLRIAGGSVLFIAAVAMAFIAVRPSSAVPQSARTYDINTLAGKVASVNAAAGLHIRFSESIEQAAEQTFAPGPFAPGPLTPITPTYVLTSPLDGTTVLAPAVTVNQDTARLRKPRRRLQLTQTTRTGSSARRATSSRAPGIAWLGRHRAAHSAAPTTWAHTTPTMAVRVGAAIVTQTLPTRPRPTRAKSEH
jgi:hypothetical protein